MKAVIETLEAIAAGRYVEGEEREMAARALATMTDLSVTVLPPLVKLEPELLQACQDLERSWRQLYPEGVAGPYIINSADENAKAQQLQATAADLKKRLEERKKLATEPYNEAVKSIRKIVSDYSDPVEAILAAVVPAMSKWYTAEQKRIRDEQQRINDEAAKQTVKAEKKAERKGEEPPPPLVPPVLPQVQKSTDLGDVKQTMRDNWVYKINGVSESEWGSLRRNDPRTKGIPDALFLLDTATLSRQARGSRGVNPYDGTPIRFENEPVPANRK